MVIYTTTAAPTNPLNLSRTTFLQVATDTLVTPSLSYSIFLLRPTRINFLSSGAPLGPWPARDLNDLLRNLNRSMRRTRVNLTKGALFLLLPFLLPFRFLLLSYLLQLINSLQKAPDERISKKVGEKKTDFSSFLKEKENVWVRYLLWVISLVTRNAPQFIRINYVLDGILIYKKIYFVENLTVH